MAQREGYLLLDHRASPGLPADFARAMGIDPVLASEGKLFEAATLTCVHCTNVVLKNRFRLREREKCMKCGGKYVCDACAYEASLPDYDHTPFEKKRDDCLDAAVKGLGSPPALLLR